MPWAAAIPAIGAVAGGALNLIGSSNAANTQQQASQAALDFAKQQEAERIREFNLQQQEAQYAWQTQQANLAPYRAARAAVLGRYGVPTDVNLPPPPPGLFGAPGAVPTPSVGGGGVPGAGGGFNPFLAAGLGAAAGGAAMLLGHNFGQDQGVAGPPSSLIQGGPPPQEMAGPPSSMIQGGPPPVPSPFGPQAALSMPSLDTYQQAWTPPNPNPGGTF